MGLSILIVDDEVITRETLYAVLKKSFFFPAVYMATDAKQTIKVIKEKDIDIILLDIRLPDIDGLELIQMVRNIKPNTEIIIITGYGSEGIAIQSLRKGAIDYIEKPVNLDSLLAAIGRAEERLIAKKRLVGKNTVLVVADEAETTTQLKEAVMRCGYEVLEVNSGKDAQTILESNKIDVLITDITLQDTRGIEILKEAKKLQQYVEAIVITDVKDNQLAVRALQAGAFSFLQKPVDPALLRIVIKRALERVKLHKNIIFRSRELKITSEIITKVNEELEKRIEERSQELLKTQAQLFQTSKLATLGEMSAGLAHELNQPLGAIALTTKYMSKMLDRGGLKNEELGKAIQDIDYSIKRMTSVIQHIRTFARQDTLKFVEVSINETVEAALNLLAEQLRLHEVYVIKNLAEDLPCIAGEPFQLEQVWLNLLANARDATEEKAARLKGCQQDGEQVYYKKAIQISTLYEKKKVVFIIKDNGTGMSEEEKHRMFEPFFTTKEVGQAMGLGLAISYGIIESHNGKIEVESREGEGTIIRILFDPVKERHG